MKKKITLKEFFENKEKLAINCTTFKQACNLLAEFKRADKDVRRSKIKSFYDNTKYAAFGKLMCYTNKGTYANLHYLESKNIKVYKFKDVILNKIKKEKENE